MRKAEVTINIRATSEKALAAFTDPGMLREWWNVERTLIDLKPGGLYTLAWNISENGFGFVSTGIIKEYQPHQLLVIDQLVYLNPGKQFFGPMTLTVKARENGIMTEVYLCQDGYQDGADWDWYHDVVREAWPAVMQTLKNYLEKNNDAFK